MFRFHPFHTNTVCCDTDRGLSKDIIFQKRNVYMLQFESELCFFTRETGRQRKIGRERDRQTDGQRRRDIDMEVESQSNRERERVPG